MDKKDEALKLARKALQEVNYDQTYAAEISVIDEALAEQPAQQQEQVAHSIAAGALFDFMGWLTSRQRRLVLSGIDDAAPAVKAIQDFAKMRSLSLDDAQVQEWQEHLATPQRREWVGLTEQEQEVLWDEAVDRREHFCSQYGEFADAIEAKLKEKNA